MTCVNTNNHANSYADKKEKHVEHNLYVSDLILRSVGPLGIHICVYAYYHHHSYQHYHCILICSQ